MAYDAFFQSVFSRMDPETAHERAFAAIRAGRFVTPRLFSTPSAPVVSIGRVAAIRSLVSTSLAE